MFALHLLKFIERYEPLVDLLCAVVPDQKPAQNSIKLPWPENFEDFFELFVFVKSHDLSEGRWLSVNKVLTVFYHNQMIRVLDRLYRRYIPRMHADCTFCRPFLLLTRLSGYQRRLDHLSKDLAWDEVSLFPADLISFETTLGPKQLLLAKFPEHHWACTATQVKFFVTRTSPRLRATRGFLGGIYSVSSSNWCLKTSNRLFSIFCRFKPLWSSLLVAGSHYQG